MDGGLKAKCADSLNAGGFGSPRKSGPADSARGRVFRAILWAAASKGSCEAVRYARIIVLARILSPEDFGVFGIGLLVLGVLEAFTEPGLHTALVQRAGPVARYLDSVFVACAARGFILAIALWICAPLGARFWDVPQATALIRSTSLVTILRGLANPAATMLFRELDFRTLFLWNLLEALTSLVVALVLGLSGFGIWALAGSLVAGEAARTGISYALRPWSPRFQPNWADLRALARFGRWVMATNAAVFIGLQLDGALVAKMVSAFALGYYQMAQRLAALPRMTLVAVLNHVALPALSRAQGDRRRVRRLAIALWLVSLAAAGVPATIMVIFSGPLVALAFGPVWAPAAPLLAIMSIAQLLRSLAVVPSSYFYAVGRPWVTLSMNIARAGGLVAVIWPLVSAYDAEGAAWASVVGSAALTVAWIVPLAAGARPRARAGTLGPEARPGPGEGSEPAA
ncbi:MAG: lipopolysaccharide biosynthesis protein [Planctomycetota bacterium]